MENPKCCSTFSAFLTGCRDNYPRKMTASCKRTYSCSKLKSKCNWTFRKVLPSKCEKNVPSADLKKRVSQYCKKSCGTQCPGNQKNVQKLSNDRRFIIMNKLINSLIKFKF